MKNKNIELHRILKADFNKFSANIIADKITKKLDEKTEVINVALSGGTTPLPILELLKDKPINWEKVNFFMVDERCVPLDSTQSNYGNIKKVFFNHIESKSFSMIQDDISLEKSLEMFEKNIRINFKKSKNNIPVFDLILLGMGDDGHIASLFPNTSAIDEFEKIVVPNYVPQQKSHRITLTYPALLNADEFIIIIKGNKKKQLFEEIYSEKNDMNYPIIELIRANVKISWIIGD